LIFDIGDKGRIAYLQTKDSVQMQKLMNIGVIPGMSIDLLQKFPSYIVSLGQAQFAIDKELASVVYVRLTK
jgi:Fe2+ transport system protein FeoA